jgi:hypothetical protein
MFKSELLREEQRPVVTYPLIATHPVEDRAFFEFSLVEKSNAARINHGRTGYR